LKKSKNSVELAQERKKKAREVFESEDSNSSSCQSDQSEEGEQEKEKKAVKRKLTFSNTYDAIPKPMDFFLSFSFFEEGKRVCAFLCILDFEDFAFYEYEDVFIAILIEAEGRGCWFKFLEFMTRSL